MKTLRACVVLGIAVAGACVAAESPAYEVPELVAAQRPARSAMLFNGRDLTGWKLYLKDDGADPAKVWSTHDGVLSLVGKPNGYLRTEKTYTNFHLHVEWRWPADGSPKSNSGVFVHVHGPDTIWPAGVECQLASGNAGQLVGMDVAIPAAPIINRRPRAPKLAASSEKPTGAWNTYDIVCRGDTIDATVNGVHQNHVEKVSVREGSIGLQMEGYPIEFRNVWLEKL
jgi:hypothetical protein